MYTIILAAIHQILRQYWGYDSFRPMQEEIIQSVLDKKDTLALLPTGGGKSVCFQVPALAQDGICIVVSPLIALMKDQVQNLSNKGIPALAIFSGMPFLEIKKTLQNAAYGNYKFLYVSPERLETDLFLEYLPAFNVNLIAVDEAHCISQWGYDFRPPYLRIQNLREHLPNVPILALTASATLEVQNDICEKLNFGKISNRFQKTFARPNLSYSVFNVASKHNKLLEVVTNVKGSGIVYCKSRKHTKDIADLLVMNKISADYYHAGLTHEQRNEKQESWIKNKTRIIVCTNAFGMGIDKPDVRFVVHFDVPDCLENYYQEAGRAGRDEKRAYAVLLYANREPEDLNQQIEIRFPKLEDIKHVYKCLMNHLQIAAGSGEGFSYPFDLGFFATSFKLNILTATYAIKALEQLGYISFNESFFQPTKIEFTCSRETLEEYEKVNQQFDSIIKGLLRSYAGIFDFPATVYEKKFAAFVKKDIHEIQNAFTKLEQNGIINYNKQKEGPQITLLKNRIPFDQLVINIVDYNARKEKYKTIVKKILEYLNIKLCRSKFIANYFNDYSLIDCGICDVCINANTPEMSHLDFQTIAKKILSITNNLKVNEILIECNEYKKDKVWKVIEFLKAENKISFSNTGEIKIH